MACPAPETFGAFVSGKLAEPARDELELHVDACGSCRVTLSELGRGARHAVAATEAIGRYTIAGELGAGAMGVVYLARDPELDREVAIKLVHPQAGAPENELVAQRVLREGRALARIDHANVVRVFDVGRSDGALFVAMERAPGVTLRAWLATPRQRQAIVDVFAQCARGLAAAHAAGVVHRDFKPDNVIVDDRGHARVADFGLAQTDRAEVTDGMVGTPAYMAPEQLRGEPSDAEADQFAWGVAFAEALTGKRPFTAHRLEDRLAEMRRPLVADVPRRARRVLERALAFEPAARFPSMTAAAEALRTPRRWWPFAVLAAILAGVLVVAVMRGRGDACAGVDAEIDRAWNAPRAERLGRIFAATAKPFADRAWQYARTATETYAGAWKAMRIGVCRAGVERGELDAATRARTVTCLERRVVDLEAVLARWETGSIDALAAAPAMVDRLAAPAACATATEDRAPLAVHARFAAARTSIDAGQAREAEAQLLALERELADHPALRADVLVALGGVARDLGKRDAAREHFLAALSAGELAHADRARAGAYLGLAQSSGEDFQRTSEARESLRLADAVLERLGQPRDLARQRDAVLGLVAVRDNQPAQAVEVLRRSIADDVPPTQRAMRMQMLARALIVAGDITGAIAELERAEQVLTATLGPSAPQLVFVLNSMMEPLAHLGRHGDAITRGERALALIDATYGKDHPRRSRILGNLGDIYARSGDHQRAKAIMEDVLRLAEPDSLDEANTRVNLGSTLHDLGDDTGAILHLERAKAIYTRQLGPDAPLVANVLGALADAQAALGRPAEALALTERALAIREVTNTPPGYLAYTRFHFALALEINGQRKRAVEMAKRALELPLADTGREADLAKQIRSWLATHR